MPFGEMTVQELKALMDDNTKFVLLDVREDYEREICVLPGARHIPMNSIPERIDELSPDDHIIVQCKVGGRSAQVAHYLVSNGFNKVDNLVGGINAWSSEIDNSVAFY